MTPITFLTWLSSVLAVSAAIFACAAARRGLAAHLLQRFSKLQEAFEQLKQTVSAQETAIMNLRARLTMQATRGKRANAADSTDSSLPSDEDSKAEVRRRLSAALASGQIKPPGR